MRAIDAAEAYAREAGIDFAALVELVRAAMASGVACFTDRARAGEVDPMAPLSEAFGDFPAEFLRYRPSLIQELTSPRRVDTTPASEGAS